MLGCTNRFKSRPSKNLFLNHEPTPAEFGLKPTRMLSVSNSCGGCGSFKSFLKKLKGVGKKIFKGVGKVGDFLLNTNKKIIHALGTNDSLRNIVGAVPVVGDTINTLTKIGSNAMDAADKVADNIRNKKPIFNDVNTEELKQNLNEVKNDKNISKFIDDAKKYANDTLTKIRSSNLSNSDKQEIEKAAGLLNYDVIENAKTPLQKGKIAKMFKYLPLVKLEDMAKDKRVNIPMARLKAIGEASKKSITPKQQCGMLFMGQDGGRWDLGGKTEEPKQECGRTTLRGTGRGCKTETVDLRGKSGKINLLDFLSKA